MKRAFDLCLSSIGLILSAPLWIAIPIAIRLEDGGPIFFSQARIGLNGRVFLALKFRSMIPDAEADQRTGPGERRGSARHDGRPRATRDGHGRTAPVVEHPGGRHELCRTEAASTRRDRRVRRQADRLARRPGLRTAPQRPARIDRTGSGVCAARSTPGGEVPPRSSVLEGGWSMSGSQASAAVVLDYGSRRVGASRPASADETSKGLAIMAAE